MISQLGTSMMKFFNVYMMSGVMYDDIAAPTKLTPEETQVVAKRMHAESTNMFDAADAVEEMDFDLGDMEDLESECPLADIITEETTRFVEPVGVGESTAASTSVELPEDIGIDLGDFTAEDDITNSDPTVIQ